MDIQINFNRMELRAIYRITKQFKPLRDWWRHMLALKWLSIRSQPEHRKRHVPDIMWVIDTSILFDIYWTVYYFLHRVFHIHGYIAIVDCPMCISHKEKLVDHATWLRLHIKYSGKRDTRYYKGCIAHTTTRWHTCSKNCAAMLKEAEHWQIIDDATAYCKSEDCATCPNNTRC